MFTLGVKVEVFWSPSFRPSKTSVSVVAAGSSEAGADPGVGTSAEVVVVSMPREMRRCLLSAVVDTVGTVVTSGIQNRIIRVKKIWILRHPAYRFFFGLSGYLFRHVRKFPDWYGKAQINKMCKALNL